MAVFSIICKAKAKPEHLEAGIQWGGWRDSVYVSYTGTMKDSVKRNGATLFLLRAEDRLCIVNGVVVVSRVEVGARRTPPSVEVVCVFIGIDLDFICNSVESDVNLPENPVPREPPACSLDSCRHPSSFRAITLRG
jgi:hypothetical protein